MGIDNGLDTIVAWAKESAPEELPPVLSALNERHPGLLERTIQQLLVEPELELPRPVLVGEFLRTVGTPPPMLIERLIPDHSLVLVTGKPKHAKSYLALDILDTTCRGVSAMGALALSRTGPVLYLSMEDGPYETANRLLKRGIRADDTRPLYLCSGRLNIAQPAHLAHIRAALEELKPVLLVIDTAREGCGVRDWTDPSEVADKLRPIRGIARDYCSVLLVAHNRKAEGANGDEISGTNALTSSVDGWISIKRKEPQSNGNLRLFAETDGRAGMRGDMVFEMDTSDLHFRLLTDEELAETKREEREMEQERRKQSVRDAIADTPGAKATVIEISDRCDLGYETVKALVREMVDGGELARAGEKATGGRGRPSPIYEVIYGKNTSIPRERTVLPQINPYRDPSESRLAEEPSPANDEERDL